jgi:hypothetical protein
MVVVTLQTQLRDPQNPGDSGLRTVYLRWHSLNAVRDAIRAAGCNKPEIGAMLQLTYSSNGPKPDNRKFNPAKLYTARYKPAPPPSAQAAGDAIMEEPAATPWQEAQANGWRGTPPASVPQGRQPAAPPSNLFEAIGSQTEEVPF